MVFPITENTPTCHSSFAIRHWHGPYLRRRVSPRFCNGIWSSQPKPQPPLLLMLTSEAGRGNTLLLSKAQPVQCSQNADGPPRAIGAPSGGSPVSEIPGLRMKCPCNVIRRPGSLQGLLPKPQQTQFPIKPKLQAPLQEPSNLLKYIRLRAL